MTNIVIDAPAPSPMAFVAQRLLSHAEYEAFKALAPSLSEADRRAHAQGFLDLVGESCWRSGSGSSDHCWEAASLMMSWGADPWKASEDPSSRGSKSSFAQKLYRQKNWGLLSCLAKRGASETLKNLLDGQSAYGLGWRGSAFDSAEKKAEMEAFVKLCQLMSGFSVSEESLKAGFAMGLDPNAVGSNGDPWIFCCQNEGMLKAFCEAGADLNARSASGAALSQAFAKLDGAKLRQAMLSLLHSKLAEAHAPIDPLAAQKQAFALMKKGASPKEIASQFGKGAPAKQALLSARLEPGGPCLLEASLKAGHMSLAKEMLAIGADPQELGSEGIPKGLAAAFSHFDTTSRAREARKAVLSSLVPKLDPGWRDAEGRLALEACVAKFKEAHYWNFSMAQDFLEAWIDLEPQRPELPLWKRLLDLGAGSGSMSQAYGKKESEPCSFGGASLFKELLRHASGSRWGSHSIERSLLFALGKAEQRGQRAFSDLLSGVFEDAASACAQSKDSGDAFGVQYFGSLRAAASICERNGWREPFDRMESASGLAMALSSVDGSYAFERGKAINWAGRLMEFDKSMCARFFLDMLLDGPRSSERGASAKAIWRSFQEKGEFPDLNIDHPAYGSPEALAPWVVGSEFWGEVEKAALAEQARVARARRI